MTTKETNSLLNNVDAEMHPSIIGEAETEPSTTSRNTRANSMIQYATPPHGESGAERKARHHRKRQAEYRLRKRNLFMVRSMSPEQSSTVVLRDITNQQPNSSKAKVKTIQAESSTSSRNTSEDALSQMPPFALTLEKSTAVPMEVIPDGLNLTSNSVDAEMHPSTIYAAQTEPSTSSRTTRANPMIRFANLPDEQITANISQPLVSTAEMQPAIMRSAEAEPSTSSRTTRGNSMTRYATPPDGESAAERKARLNRKRQAEFYLRKRNLSIVRQDTTTQHPISSKAKVRQTTFSTTQVESSTSPRNTSVGALSQMPPFASTLEKSTTVPMEVVSDETNLLLNNVDAEMHTSITAVAETEPSTPSHTTRPNLIIRIPNLPVEQIPENISQSIVSTAERQHATIRSAETEPSTSSRTTRDISMSRYATPPDGESAAERKARLNRKRQAERRQRNRLNINEPHLLPASVPVIVTATNDSSLPTIGNGNVRVNATAFQYRREYEAQRRRQIMARNRNQTYKVGIGYYENYQHPPRFQLRSRQPCQHCAALNWPGETSTICCNGGQVILPPFDEPPSALRQLFQNKEFMEKIRAYNNAFAFTSMGASVRVNDPVRQDNRVAGGGGGPYNYRVQGALCHRIGALTNLPGNVPIYAQLYFYDSTSVEQSNAMVDARMVRTRGVNREIVQILQEVFDTCNPLAEIFRHAHERMTDEEDLQLCIHARLPGVDQRRYNRPTVDEVGGIFLATESTEQRDIILQYRTNGGLKRVAEHNQLYDALQYPLLHPYGEVGWTFGIPKAPRRGGNRAAVRDTDGESGDENREETHSARQVTPREYAAYRLSWREGENSLILLGGRLMQQYCVDQYCKMEAQRLKYQRDHQAQLRADVYAGVMDMAAGDNAVDIQQDASAIPDGPNPSTTLARTGTRVILAPSFVGSDRYMRAQYQDAMAIVRAMGKPDLFITVTCNPQWPEVKEALLPSQSPTDRPDLTVRVFRLKLKAILEDLSAGALGLEVARIHVIEFQKRGLPHAHMLVILGDADKPRSPADYDRLVSAEIPDPANGPLHETITNCMMHGPCGRTNPTAPCMKDGVCSKHFPKAFCEVTGQGVNGYPLYRRRNDGRTVTVKRVLLDNRYVVPYNPWLSEKYNCHINVEICSTVTSVKYMYKYVYKGHDRVSVSAENSSDEIQQFLDARYISASESCWRIMRFELQAKSHTVVQLPIHLEHQQSVVFRANATVTSLLDRGRHTMLTRFFELAAHDDFARTLVYQDVPIYYRYAAPKPTQRLPWHGTGKNWIRRCRQSGNVIGRMVSCSMIATERYCLRLLLCYRKGPTSFTDLRTVGGTHCASFHQAAITAGLLQDDSEWDRALEEATSFRMPAQLRYFFALILTQGLPERPRRLWDAYSQHLCEDFRYQHRERYTVEESEQNRMLGEIERYRALSCIECYMRSSTPSKSLIDFPDMPQLADFVHVERHLESDVNPHIDAERSYNVSDLQQTLSTVHLLNSEQREVYEIITAAVDCVGSGNETEAGNLFFLDGPGGTGKSFLLEKILAYTRQQSKVALATAASGIAALLLTGGKTVHSTFKLPLVLDEHTKCTIPVQSHLAELMRQAVLIVWDEASMSSRYALEAVDRTLQDIVGENKPFGGKVMLLCGDFRQILPVVPKGTDAQIIAQCIKRSPLWQTFRNLRLKENMRVKTAPDLQNAAELQEFSDLLLRFGEGRHNRFPGLDESFAQLPRDMILPASGNLDSDLRALIDRIYPAIGQHYSNPAYFTDRAILSPLNVDVNAVNNIVLERLPEQETEYRSVDTLVNEEEHANLQLPSEYLNSLNISGIPVHQLRLKRYVPVLLLRNLNTQQGLCNGTRLQVIDLRPNCIHARIMTGKRLGEDVLLPRIYCDSNDAGLPFQIRRKQFPVQLCFSMTINKSQGQSLHHLGLYLPTSVFTHGQLYVALSRVTSRQNISVLIVNSEAENEDSVAVKNIVYKEVV